MVENIVTKQGLMTKFITKKCLASLHSVKWIIKMGIAIEIEVLAAMMAI